jgi:polyphosphate kinase
MCCLRPGRKGLSANIAVRSIVDRFLEHSRVWWFENACHPEAYVTSADWMQRNFFRRIEMAFPIEDGRLADRLISEVLAISFADNSKAHELQGDGSYRRMRPAKGEPIRNQIPSTGSCVLRRGLGTLLRRWNLSLSPGNKG